MSSGTSSCVVFVYQGEAEVAQQISEILNHTIVTSGSAVDPAQRGAAWPCVDRRAGLEKCSGVAQPAAVGSTVQRRWEVTAALKPSGHAATISPRYP